MKILISPAKSLDFERQLPTSQYTESIFLSEAERINKLLRKKTVNSLSKLMDISSSLAQLNYERNQQWNLPFTLENARPAIYAFSGDVFRGLDAYSLPEHKIDHLQNSVRILSGQYGLLKPLDLMQPYRLEMGTKFPIGKNKDLYSFWKPKITKALNDELQKDELCINLASIEYFKAIDTKKLKVPVINIGFKELKNGEYKTIMTYAKLARGYMTRYIIENDVKTVEDVKGFTMEGYGFSDALSQKENELVFVR
ncbi:peroxide stress protein YaaA [Arenibacter sp. GZD96]|uniref:peroxide stress protein YaaA n=1 Tax=Aurantibrevibacter litoralis TaxID=3106030 RepID=UPI002AFFF909|nr:peroxide stress protein YaaA [Arenibacter sp. GZD-96]MEA1786839.1 peroxide stress protein YaaA [Arenibacter sp. GZD-96]